MNEKLSKKLLEYNSQYDKKINDKKIATQVIKEITKIDLQHSDIQIKDNWLILHTSSVLKKEVLLREKKIIEKVTGLGLVIKKIK